MTQSIALDAFFGGGRRGGGFLLFHSAYLENDHCRVSDMRKSHTKDERISTRAALLDSARFVFVCLFVCVCVCVFKIPSICLCPCFLPQTALALAWQTLAKTTILGLKTVIWCCSNYRQPKSDQEAAEAAAAAATAASVATGNVVSPVPPVATRRPMTLEERNYTAKFFKWALPCLRVFTRSGGVTPAAEWKEALDAFAGAFTVLGPYDLRMAVRGREGFWHDGMA